MSDNKMWHEKHVTLKENRAVVKLHNESNGEFLKSIIVPTVYYPLNGNYEVFHYKNTEQVMDEAILKAFDKIKYSIGHCYQNTELLVSELRKQGYDAKSYVGWLFVGLGQIPIHHCWAVLDGKYVLDLSDDYTQMLSGENGKNFKDAKNIEEERYIIASFHESARNVENHIRCYPVGIPTPFLYYVGCECEPEEGRRIYQRLMRTFPDHECQRNCDSSGYNATQRVLKDAGLMD